MGRPPRSGPGGARKAVPAERDARPPSLGQWSPTPSKTLAVLAAAASLGAMWDAALAVPDRRKVEQDRGVAGLIAGPRRGKVAG